MPSITLSDNTTIEYRKLGLFELYDGLPFEALGHYTYSILTITGAVIEQEIDLTKIETVPTMPDDPEPEPNSPDYWQLKEYEIYQAAIVHERKRAAQIEDYLNRAASYILANCIDDPKRIVTADDYNRLFVAATVPHLTMEGLQAELSSFFQGHLQRLRPVYLPIRPATAQVSQPG